MPVPAASTRGSVAGIHGIGGALETLKTWMAGTRPGYDANGGGLVDQVALVSARRKCGKCVVFPRRAGLHAASGPTGTRAQSAKSGVFNETPSCARRRSQGLGR